MSSWYSGKDTKALLSLYSLVLLAANDAAKFEGYVEPSGVSLFVEVALIVIAKEFVELVQVQVQVQVLLL